MVSQEGASVQVSDREEALRRLGVPILVCDRCQGQFVLRGTFYVVHIYCDGELAEDGDVVFCKHECAQLWAEDYNASTERAHDGFDRHAVPSSAETGLPEEGWLLGPPR